MVIILLIFLIFTKLYYCCENNICDNDFYLNTNLYINCNNISSSLINFCNENCYNIQNDSNLCNNVSYPLYDFYLNICDNDFFTLNLFKNIYNHTYISSENFCNSFCFYNYTTNQSLNNCINIITYINSSSPYPYTPQYNFNDSLPSPFNYNNNSLPIPSYNHTTPNNETSSSMSNLIIIHFILRTLTIILPLIS